MLRLNENFQSIIRDLNALEENVRTVVVLAGNLILMRRLLNTIKVLRANSVTGSGLI